MRPAAEVIVVDDFATIADEWDALAQECAASPFMRPGWMAAWWSAFGRGTLQVLTVRRSGRLAAVLPLWRRGSRLHACANVHSPLFDTLAIDDEAALLTLTEALDRCSALTLGRVLSDGNLARLVRSQEIGTKARRSVLRTVVAPFFLSSMDPAEFEHSLGQRRRGEMRRRRRRLADEGRLSFQLRSPPSRLADDLQELFLLEASGWKADAGTAILMNDATTQFYTDLTRWAAETDRLRLSLLRLDDRLLAGLISLFDDSHVYSLKIGYDTEYSRFGPGSLLTFDEISRALVQGRSFEHGGGENELKDSLSNGSRTIEDVALFPHTRRGFLTAVAVGGRAAAYETARHNRNVRRARDRVRGLLTAGRRPT